MILSSKSRSEARAGPGTGPEFIRLSPSPNLKQVRAGFGAHVRN